MIQDTFNTKSFFEKMRKNKMLSLLSAVVVVITFYLVMLYKFTALYPPIKNYEFPIAVTKLSKEICLLGEDKGKYECVVIDTIENAYRAEINIKMEQKKYKYLIKYYDEKSFFKISLTSKIELIGAFDLNDNFGGYKMQDKRMMNLIKIFEDEFVDKLN